MCVCVCLLPCVWDPGLAVYLSAVIGGVAILFWPLDTVRSFHCTGRQIALLCPDNTPSTPGAHILFLTCRGYTGLCLAVAGGPRCRNQAQILTPDQSALLWA